MIYCITNQIKNIWKFRDLAVELFWTFLKLRHVGSVLGFIWTLVNPLLYILTYWIVFSLIIRMGLENYPLFLIPGYLAWSFTFNSIITSSDSILQSKELITKIAFPNEIIVLTNIAVGLVDFLISLIIFIFIIVIFYSPISFYYLFVIPLLLIQILFTIGICMIVSCISVYFKDVPKLILVFGNIIFFLTPIFYPLSFIPSRFRNIILINPIAQIITIYHDLIYYKQSPDVILVVVSVAVSLGFFILGFFIFNKLRYSFAELS
jgi:lipopolysaccharide transport system permease protein